MKTIFIISGVALASLAGNAYFLNAKIREHLALDACAAEAWIYACQMEARPIIKEDKIVYRPAPILPPPVSTSL